MAITSGLLRPLAAGAIAAGSILAGLFLAFRLITPSLAAQLPTPELMGLLGLLALPPLTLWAMWADRAAANALPVPQPEPIRTNRADRTSRLIEPKPIVFAAVEVDDPTPTEPEVELHAPGRRAVRHRRHDPARTPA